MSRTVIYQGQRISLVQERIPLPDGGEKVKDIVLHPGAAVIIPLLPDDRVCLVSNYRVSIHETLLELPAGTLDPGESPDATAVRELREETGYRAGRCRRIAEFYPSPGVLTERMYLYVAEELTPGPMHLDAGERLEPVILRWDEALAKALDGNILDGKTILGLLLWDRLRG